MVKRQPSKPDEEFWSYEQTAEYLDVSLGTLKYWRYMGTGPRSYRIGKYRRFRPSDVQKWLDNQAEEPTASR